MPQTDLHVVEGPLLPSRVQRDGHRRSGAEGTEEQVVRTGAGIGAAVGQRLVRQETMATDCDLLRKPGCAPTHQHHTGFERLIHWKAPRSGSLEHNLLYSELLCRVSR